MKKKIIELVEKNSTEFWDKYSDEYTDPTDEQVAVINKLNDELADEIINLFKKDKS